MIDFHLVQRLTRRDMLGAKGFDRLFGCDYMGAAEFEWGAIPDSLKRIRGARRVEIHEGTVVRNGESRTVYVVAERKNARTIPDRLTEWLVDEYPRGKEPSYFPEHFDRKPLGSWQERVVAWWGLNEDAMWTLDRVIADDLLRAVTR